MEQSALERAKLDELKKKAESLGLESTGTRGVLVDRILDHLEERVRHSERGETEVAAAVTIQRGAASGSRSDGECQPQAERSNNTVLEQMLVMMQRMSQTQELLVQQLALLSTGPRAPAGTLADDGSVNVVQDESSRPNSRRSGVSDSRDMIKKLASQIPIFKGTEKENVDRWLSRVSFVGELYEVSDETLLLIATGRFDGKASKWYARQSNDTLNYIEHEKNFSIHRRYHDSHENDGTKYMIHYIVA